MFLSRLAMIDRDTDVGLGGVCVRPSLADIDSKLMTAGSCSFHYRVAQWYGCLVVRRRTCDLVVAGSRPGRDVAA